MTRHYGGPERKTFRQWTPVPGGRWFPALNGTRRVLFRLPELITADPTAPVFVLEGEKDALNLAALGLVRPATRGVPTSGGRSIPNPSADAASSSFRTMTRPDRGTRTGRPPLFTASPRPLES